MSVLYVSHGHPAFAKGGGELAAWRLFERFATAPALKAVVFWRLPLRQRSYRRGPIAGLGTG